MIKLIDKMLLASALSLLSISPSFSMDPSEDHEKSPALATQQKVGIANQSEAEECYKKALEHFKEAKREYKNKKNWTDKIKGKDKRKSKDKKGESVNQQELGENLKNAAIKQQELGENLKNAAIKQQELGEGLMRKASVLGSLKAKQYREREGYWEKDYDYACKLLINKEKQEEGLNLMKILINEGYGRAKEISNTMGLL